MRILLVEDDAEAADYVVKGLAESGHHVDLAVDGYDGLQRAKREPYDVMIIDRMLPGLDGLSIITTLRDAGDNTPILVLSALGEVEERVEGLSAGGDDYLVKPFALSELLARLSALTRRGGTVASRLNVADLEMDLLARTVTRAGKPIDLLPREFRLLEHLMRHAGQVLTRTMLLEMVWDSHVDPQTNVIDVHVGRLRQKVDRGFASPLLHTVRGAGYCLRST